MMTKEYHRKVYIQPLIEVVDTEENALDIGFGSGEDVDNERHAKGTSFFFDDDDTTYGNIWDTDDLDEWE